MQPRRLVRACAVPLAALVLLSACQLTFQPVDLGRTEHPGVWNDNFSAGRVSPPAGR